MTTQTKPTLEQVLAALGGDTERLRHAYLDGPDGQRQLDGILMRPEPADTVPAEDGRMGLRLIWADGSRDAVFPVDGAGASEGEASFTGPLGELRLRDAADGAVRAASGAVSW